MSSYPSGMSVCTRGLIMLADALRRRRTELRSRWRRSDPGRQALLVLAHLRKGDTYAEPACGFAVDTSTVYCYLNEALELLAAMAPTLAEAIEVARRKAYVILDGTLLRIDRVGMTDGSDRPFYSGKYKRHGVNVQILADPIGRLIWISPTLPGARHDMGAAHEHGLIDALTPTRGPRPGRQRLPGRRPRDPRPPAPAPARPGHRPLPTPVAQPEAGQHRPRPPPRPR